VLADENHLRAFALTCALVFSSFLLGPFLPTFLTDNVGVDQENLKLMYLCGGLATLATMTVFGRLADRFGKLRVFRVLALLTMVPILIVTNLPAGLSLWLVLSATTLFMVMMSGRMVPAMALLTATAAPAYRGSFMSCNSAVQQLAAGIATSIGGLLLHQEQGGTLAGFEVLGVLCCAAAAISVVLAGQLRKAPASDVAVDEVDIPEASLSVADIAEPVAE